MKILFITNYPSPYRVDFFNELGKKEGINLSVIFLEEISEQKHRSDKWFNENYNHFEAIFLKKRRYLSKVRYICPEIKEYLKKKYDEIILGGYSYPTMIYAIQYLKRKRIPFSIEVDGGFISNDKPVIFKFKHYLISSASKWYSSGKETDKYLIHYGAKSGNIVHYPFSSLNENDIKDALSFNINEKQQYKERIGIKESFMILTVGQFIYRKGFDILLDACCEINKDVAVVFVGGEPTEEYINMKHSYGLANVYFEGFKEKQELANYYKAADGFVLPTREDIWGLVINEAMAYGLPVISTDRCIAGMELITPGENGFIVKAGDAAELAEAINQLIYADRVKIGRISQSIIAKYTIENMADIHYQSIVNNYQ